MDRMTPEQYQEILRRFDATDQRFESIDRRFDSVDQRFDSVDQRFESIDQRFESINGRFDSVESRIAGVEKHLRAELMLKTSALWRDFKDELRSVKEELLDAIEKTESFASDVNDRLSRRISNVAAFVGMSSEQLLDEGEPNNVT
jgi:hypothetical protein